MVSHTKFDNIGSIPARCRNSFQPLYYDQFLWHWARVTSSRYDRSSTMISNIRLKDLCFFIIYDIIDAYDIIEHWYSIWFQYEIKWYQLWYHHYMQCFTGPYHTAAAPELPCLGICRPVGQLENHNGYATIQVSSLAWLAAVIMSCSRQVFCEISGAASTAHALLLN